MAGMLKRHSCQKLQMYCLVGIIGFWVCTHFSVTGSHLRRMDLHRPAPMSSISLRDGEPPQSVAIGAVSLLEEAEEADDDDDDMAALAATAREPDIVDGPMAGTPENLHIVYQLACSAYSLHNAIALDWSWREVKQPGRLTRIVCGCDTETEKEMLRLSPLRNDPKFSVFFSRNWNAWVPTVFAEVVGDEYHAFNHPFGIRDWLDQSKFDEEYVAYMEPDMVFVKPILFHVPDGDVSVHVTRGNPVGMHYRYIRASCPDPCPSGDPGWADFASPEVCGDDCPAAISASADEADYAVGPPTILHKADWQRLAGRWSNYSVHIRSRARMKSDGVSWIPKGGKVYIAEMLGYSLAAAALGLEHQVVKDLAVDALSECIYPFKSGCHEAHLLHYCYPQNVKAPGAGQWIWNKYRMPAAFKVNGPEQWTTPLFLDCDMPLLEEPPDITDAKSWNTMHRERHVYWMIRKIILAYNGGFSEVKASRCPPNKLEKRKLMRVDEDRWYVPAKSVQGTSDLSSRLTQYIRQI
eukprot:TRINITY_DN40450_c0_g1_i1.p1 TRINITY_DN40450_c0_g1~~TRINITY_DN40450_c0_g1_i1.p1  ORF type:complete len:522 (+),score=74.30 TRINITY_DN40450_c0_g1_i1:101-1666(+)